MASDDSVGVPTTRVLVAEMLPFDAVMVVVPGATSAATPRLMLESIVAIDVLEDVHVVVAVMSAILPDAKIPRAVKSWATP